MHTAVGPTTSPTEKLLRVAIRDRQFAAAYYLYGDDDFLKEQSMRELIAAAVDPATRDFNLDVRRGAELDAETVGSLTRMPPMMAERRVIVIRDVWALKKDAWAALERHLATPSPDIITVLLASAGANRDKEKEQGLLVRTLSVEFKPLSGDRVPKWMAHHAKMHLNADITPAAAALLQGVVGNDLAELAAELDKLASYSHGVPIDEAAVTEAVGVRRGETMGDLLDRIAARDAPGALALVDHVLAQPKATGVTIVMALSAQIIAMAWGLAALTDGLPAHRLRGEYFALLKTGRPFTGRAWPEATQAWAAHTQYWTGALLDRALDALLTADMALKTTRVSTDEQVVESLILAICAPDRDHVAA